MALILTRPDGFSAHVVMESRWAPNRVDAVAGDLVGQGSQLLFTPTPAGSAKRQHAGLSFIWDVRQNSGYVLSEALQGYAPMSSSARFTNIVAATLKDQPVPATIQGHRCEPEEAIVAAGDGSTTAFRVWRATDLQGLALRITPATNAAALTVNLSQIHLEAPPSELFRPPEGFTRYASADAMMSELVSRQHNLRRPRTGPTTEEPIIVRPGSTR